MAIFPSSCSKRAWLNVSTGPWVWSLEALRNTELLKSDWNFIIHFCKIFKVKRISDILSILVNSYLISMFIWDKISYIILKRFAFQNFSKCLFIIGLFFIMLYNFFIFYFRLIGKPNKRSRDCGRTTFKQQITMMKRLKTSLERLIFF